MAKQIITSVLTTTKKTLDGVERDVDLAIDPVRQSVLKRFPYLFLFLVTFGVAATFFGIERFIIEVSWLNDKPLLIFTLGVATLFATGTLYKKLG